MADAIRPYDLKNFYDALAEHIDRATPEKTSLFLAKLAFQLASQVKDPNTLRRALDVALHDL